MDLVVEGLAVAEPYLDNLLEAQTMQDELAAILRHWCAPAESDSASSDPCALVESSSQEDEANQLEIGRLHRLPQHVQP